MVLDASKYDLKIIKRINNTQHDPVCRVKNGRMRKSECDVYNNRPEVTVINGTLIINRVIRADSGNYILKRIDSDGTETSRDLRVIVEAPIGSVEVSSSCSSNPTSVFCSSEGDQIIYSWTLNGKILEQGPMVGNSSIDLDEGTDGNISCSVKNHVSHAQKTIRLKPCPVLVYPIALGCVALILILLFLAVCYVYKKKQFKSTPAAAGDMELIYSDVSFKKKDEKKKRESLPAVDVEYPAVRPQAKREEKEEEEVQYDEVTFTQNHSNAPESEM